MNQFIAFLVLVFALFCTVEVRSNYNRHGEIAAELISKDYQRNLSTSNWNSGKSNPINKGNDQLGNRLGYPNDNNQNWNSTSWRTMNSAGTGRSRSANAKNFSNPKTWSESRFNSGRNTGGSHTNSKVSSASKPTSSSITTRRNYRKNHDIRHICMQQKTVYTPIKTTEVYTRPLWRYVNEPCKSKQSCTRVQLVHEQTVRDVVRHKTSRQITYDCCPGWEKISKNANDCMKPVCVSSCQNGGLCTTPEACSCQPGFTGRYCERDINECEDIKPCDQLCFNTEGSYYCKCREGFFLHSDNQSCKKIEGGVDDAFEARDLENEIDPNTAEQLGSRLHKIEKLLANEKITGHGFKKSLQATSYALNSLKARLSTLEDRQQDISSFQSKLIAQDEKTRKLEHLISVLFKCKTNPLPYCP